MARIKMNIKCVGIANADRCDTARGVYREISKKQRQKFVQFLLKRYDQERETGLFKDFVDEKVVPAVISGTCQSVRVLVEARFLYRIFREGGLPH